jgi:diguanylate cyclase (GGDEF)-like protein/PAS domain S-box-containing protein
MDRLSQLELLATVLNTVADPFIIISEDGVYLEVLGGTDRSLYDEATRLKGHNIHQFMEEDFANFFMDKILATFEMKRMHCFEYQLETESVQGTSRNGPRGMQWFEARVSPLQKKYEGKRAVVAQLINITERKKMQQRLKDLSYKDSLTMVGNRRFFFEKLDNHIALFLRDKVPASIIIIDVDKFKLINDTYGHYIGDQVLVQIASIINSQLGENDYIARFGGDEFICALIGYPSSDKIIRWANTMRNAIESTNFKFDTYEMHITISIGITDMLLIDTNTTTIVCRADQALYQAKHKGRNRVEWQ